MSAAGSDAPATTTTGKPRFRRLLIYVVPALLVVIVFVWRYVFVAVSVDVAVTPEELAPDGTSSATVTVVPLNRMRTRVPFRSPAIRVEFGQGRELVTGNYNADSTAFVITAGRQSGEVVLHIMVEHFPFPIEVRIPIIPAMACAGSRALHPVL